jgi:NAD(P)-dependent dehydrogenase (short-subunit alcohol dehydrogenase family)
LPPSRAIHDSAVTSASVFRGKRKVPRCVLITGASGGIGSALAREYAGAGSRTLLLQGRDAARLQETAAQCEAQGARVVQAVLDVRDTDALRRWIAEAGAAEMPDLVIVNAGVSIHTGDRRQGEAWEDIARVFEINLTAAIATAHAALPVMRARGGGQIALVSSLAAWRGLPRMPSYSASKAAVKAWGEGMRDALKDEGVRINVVMPGYVQSQMCADMPGPKLWLWQADRAARVIRRGLAADKPRLGFPFQMDLGCFLLAMLPQALSGWILKRLGYR